MNIDTEKTEKKSEQKAVTVGKKITSFFASTKQFLHEVWVEVRPKNGRVTWPSWESVRLSTRMVIISSIGLGFFIGACDFLFSYIYKAIVNGSGI